jgi:purine-binding chemotaxis protein CheW
MASDLPDDLLGVDEDDEGGGDDGEDVERRRMVLFRIGESTYATQVEAVRTVVEPTALTPVPRSGPAIEGVMDLRGDITAVIDPHVQFASPADDEAANPRVVVIDRGPDRQAAGLLVDDVLGVESVAAPYFYDVDEADADTGPFRRVGDLVVAVIQRPDGAGGTELIGVLDTETVVESAGRTAADSPA